MEVRFVILSFACISCLVPPAYSTGILAAKAAIAGGVVKGAAALGAGALAAKGLALKGAALLAAKGVAKGAALLAAKGAIVKGAAAVAAKGAALGGAALLGAKAVKTGAAIAASKLPVLHVAEKPVLVQPVVYSVPQPESVVLSPPRLSTILDRLLGLASATKNAIKIKSGAVGDLLASLLPTRTLVKPPPALYYGIIPPPPPKIYPVPVIETLKKK